MEKKKNLSIIIAIVLIVIIILALVISNHEKIIPAKETLNILSGSENRILEPILQKFEDELVNIESDLKNKLTVAKQ